MPLLAGLLSGLFSSLVAWFAQYVTKKVAFALAAVAAFAATTVGLFGTMSLALNAISLVMPDIPGMQIAIWVALPPGVVASMSAGIAADAAITLYRWNIENIRLIAYVT